MNSGKLTDWLQVIANLGIVVGLVLVLLQMDQNEELQRVEILNQFAEAYADYEAGFAGENLPVIWEKSVIEPQNLTLAEMRALEAATYVPLLRWKYLYRLAQIGILEQEDWRSEIEVDAGYYFGTPYGHAWFQNVGRQMMEGGNIPGEVYELVSSIIENHTEGLFPQDMYEKIQEDIRADRLLQEEILTGNWEIHASVGGRIPITVYCELVQDGDTLSGTCVPVMENPEPAQLSGTISGTTAQWRYDVVFNGNPGTVAFDAQTVTADGMLGTINLSGTEAPFSAIRRPGP